MFQLTHTQLFLIPMLVLLLALLLVTVYYKLRGPRQHRRFRLNPSVFRCGFCTKVYLDQRPVPVAKCPDCGQINDPIRRQATHL